MALLLSWVILQMTNQSEQVERRRHFPTDVRPRPPREAVARRVCAVRSELPDAELPSVSFQSAAGLFFRRAHEITNTQLVLSSLH